VETDIEMVATAEDVMLPLLSRLFHLGHLM